MEGIKVVLLWAKFQISNVFEEAESMILGRLGMFFHHNSPKCLMEILTSDAMQRNESDM